MLKIFIGTSSHSSRMAINWLNTYNINHQEKDIRRISRKELVEILSLTDGGLDEVLIEKSLRAQVFRANISNLLFSDAISAIIENPTVLRVPIIIYDNKLQIGFNDQEIRKFIPTEKRRAKLSIDNR